ncbi:fatty acid desaturase [Roseofilum sp. BLCC_M154]|uniref:Fatty acid desaturase n=1 Tax=Roseofilum acuticapitatum BLCC-M154 TaxID=3022444 RepID=A0ABT7AY16_9CYAN|nr:fatty acid desaturase [Roseofilum acuticapitatum]MDJ1170963.1 fatty acid desaturase [Roseofilum acuticapitatum BLCC-M154]
MIESTSSQAIHTENPPSLKLNPIILCWITIIHLGAIFALLPQFFSWSGVLVCVLLHWITGSLGVEIGWHRLGSHRSFSCPQWVEYFLVFCGTLSAMSSPISWVGTHRLHHAHSDRDGDYHNAARGFWWSHVLWIFYHKPGLETKIPEVTHDLQDDPFYQFCHKYLLALQLALAAILFALGGWSWVMWGIFFRLVTLWHSVWIINSLAHRLGYRNFDTNDLSTNVWWLFPISYGSCWHNNHHAFPHSARCGLKWWEIDPSWGVISLLHRVGLVTKVRLPNQS